MVKMRKRNKYETLSFSWREAVAALHYANCNIYFENTMPPGKEINLVCIIDLFLLHSMALLYE